MAPELSKLASSHYVYGMPNSTTYQTYNEAVHLCYETYQGFLPILQSQGEMADLVARVYTQDCKSHFCIIKSWNVVISYSIV